MKPFNLEEYLANPSRKVVTRDGIPAKILYTDARGEYPVIALVEHYQETLDVTFSFTKDGKWCTDGTNSNKDLFFATDKPKVERFDPKTLQPFDKVLARCTESEWMPTLFGYFIDEADKDPLSPFENGERVVCVDIGYHQCIPYNEETKHLVGTLDDCPEYYKWWENSYDKI